MTLSLPTPDDLKERAPLEAVLAHYGCPLNAAGFAVCPFHDDHDPSLYVWDGNDGGRRWWCQVCGFGGDQIDFVQRYKGVSFGHALLELDRIAGRLPDVRVAPTLHRDPALDAAAIAAAATDAMSRARQPQFRGYVSLYAVGYVTRQSGEPDLHLRWDSHLRGLGWGVSDRGEAAFPHWDAEGRLTGVKYRAPDGARRSEDGSTYPDLYLSWLPRTRGSVIVCEGETDAGWASYHAAGRNTDVAAVDVRSLPRGAGAPPTEAQLASLSAWDRVYLAFDADRAGRAATERWGADLRSRREYARGVWSLRLPEGRDLRSAGMTLGEALATAALL